MADFDRIIEIYPAQPAGGDEASSLFPDTISALRIQGVPAAGDVTVAVSPADMDDQLWATPGPAWTLPQGSLVQIGDDNFTTTHAATWGAVPQLIPMTPGPTAGAISPIRTFNIIGTYTGRGRADFEITAEFAGWENNPARIDLIRELIKWTGFATNTVYVSHGGNFASIPDVVFTDRLNVIRPNGGTGFQHGAQTLSDNPADYISLANLDMSVEVFEGWNQASPVRFTLSIFNPNAATQVGLTPALPRSPAPGAELEVISLGSTPGGAELVGTALPLWAQLLSEEFSQDVVVEESPEGPSEPFEQISSVSQWAVRWNEEITVGSVLSDDNGNAWTIFGVERTDRRRSMLLDCRRVALR